MSYTLTGKVKVINDVQQISDTFKKREFVITDDSSQYPQHISFQTVQDKTKELDGINVGDEIEVSFNLRGREWTSPQGELKHFNSLDCWRIKPAGAAAPMQQVAPPSAADLPPLPDAEDDLPF